MQTPERINRPGSLTSASILKFTQARTQAGLMSASMLKFTNECHHITFHACTPIYTHWRTDQRTHTCTNARTEAGMNTYTIAHVQEWTQTWTVLQNLNRLYHSRYRFYRFKYVETAPNSLADTLDPCGHFGPLIFFNLFQAVHITVGFHLARKRYVHIN